MTEDVLADFLNKLNTLAGDYGLVVGGYQEEAGELQVLMWLRRSDRMGGVSMNKDKLIEFAKEQCEIFPEDSYMGEYLRETIKMLQVEPCEDAISRQAVLTIVGTSCLDLDNYEDEEAFCDYIKNLPPVKPVACIAKVNFSKEDMQEIVDKKVKEMVAHKKGKWINKSHTSDCGIKFVASECTCCGKKTFFDCDQLVYNYCPNCGAEMGSKE